VIINYPTGFYKSVLPKLPEDSTSVTYTISNTIPPRTNLIYPKIPAGVVLRKRDVPVVPLQQRRLEVGQLIFSLSSARRTELGSNAKQYEIGDVLDFTTDTATVVEPMLVSTITELRHDTNVLDNEAMGLSDSDAALIAEISLTTQATLTEQLNMVKQQRADAEQSITINQKTINETTKTLSALTVMYDTTPTPALAQLIERVQLKQQQVITARDNAIESANRYAAMADDLINQLRAVAVVVK
jgi:hypothetical protein